MTDTPKSDALARAARLGCWSGRVDPQPLAGGITNTNFVVTDGGRRFVVRIGDDIPVHHVLRANELAASRAAAAAGVSPAVFHHEPGALVLDFIDGRTFGAADVRDPANRNALVALVQRAHRDMPKFLRGPAAMFWVFHVVRDYAHALRAAQSRHLPLLPGLLAEAGQLEERVGAIDIVFGHNDLLPANIMHDGKRLWLVDWDYAGFNSPLFDLGGLASNAGMTDAESLDLLERYFERPVTDALRRQAAAMSAASLLRETMWSMISEIHSTLDFDYAAYTVDNLTRYRAAATAALAMD